MIKEILQPLVCERFKNDEKYREGHLRIVNALPGRVVMGLHAPEIKAVAKSLAAENGIEYILRFEKEASEALCHEEVVIWGYIINLIKCPLEERLALLARYIPVIDNWAVCDSFCSHAKWIARADKKSLWEFLQPWFESTKEFEVRFAIVAAMCYFLNDEWTDTVFNRIDTLDFGRIESQYKSAKKKPLTPQEGTAPGAAPYYARMGAAWLLATALAKFPQRTRLYVRRSNLPADIIKLYTRKARESFKTRTIEAV